MSAVHVPAPQVLLQHPAVRAALVLVVLAPAFVLRGGPEGQAEVRLRVVSLGVAVALALLWDDRAATVTTASPTGLPAVRRGRALVVVTLVAVAWVLACLVTPGHPPYAALTLQAAGLAVLLVALVGWLTRDRGDESIAALPFPVALVTVFVLTQLPQRISLVLAEPGGPGWSDERARWSVLLAVCAAAVVWLQRDPAARLRPRLRVGRGGRTPGRPSAHSFPCR